MHRSIAFPIAGLVLASGLGTAIAQERPWYVTLDTGLSRTSDPNFAGGSFNTRQGPAFGGAIGRHLGQNWRVEAAMMYRNNPVKQVSSPGFDGRPGDADWASLIVTVNALYDFNAFKWGPAHVRPYLGVGIGRAQEVDADLTSGGAQREYSGSGSAHDMLAADHIC